MVKNKWRISLSICCLFVTYMLLPGNIFARDSTRYINRKALGGFIETGIPIYKLKEGTFYVPVLFIANYHQPLFKAKKFFNLALDVSPQLGFATGKRSGLEAGLNAAILFCFAIKQNSMISLQAGSGPHYFSYPASRQAPSFIFSDNFLFEYRQQLKPGKMELNFIGGFRHISNLNTKLPNGGINNVIIGIGLCRLW